MGYYDRQEPLSVREESLRDAEEAAHEARVAETEQEVMATPEGAAEVIFDALGLAFDPADAFTHGDGPFFRAISALYAEVWNRRGPNTEHEMALIHSLEKSLANVVSGRIASENRAKFYRGAA